MPMQGASPFSGAVGRPKAQNLLATRALIYGALSLGANIVGLFIGFYLTDIAAAFTEIGAGCPVPSGRGGMRRCRQAGLGH